MKKASVIIGVVVAILVVFLTIGKDVLISQMAPKIVGDILGTRVSVEAIQLNLFTSHLRIQGLRISQPSGFGDEPLLDLKLAEIHYDWRALLANKFSFSLINIDINQLMIVKNTQDQLSIEALKPLAAMLSTESSASKRTTSGSQTKQETSIDLKIKKLRLNIQPVVLRHLKADGSWNDEQYELGLSQQEYEDIVSVNDLINRVVLSASGLKGITNAAFFAGHTVIKRATNVIDDAQQLTTGTLNAITKGAGGVVKQTGNLLKSIVNEF